MMAVMAMISSIGVCSTAFPQKDLGGMDEVAPRRVHSSVADGLVRSESKPGSVRCRAQHRWLFELPMLSLLPRSFCAISAEETKIASFLVGER